MPVEFHVHASENYFVSTWTGRLQDDELIPAYERFHATPEWHPGLHELADLRAADLSTLTHGGMVALATWTSDYLRRIDSPPRKTALLTTPEAATSLVIYEAWAEEPEHAVLFRSPSRAIHWLTKS